MYSLARSQRNFEGTMIVITAGDKARFAIESGIDRAYESLGSLALGYFVIYIHGHRYGVYAQDATLLACSFGEVEDRIARRGKHTAFFSIEPDAGAIADAYRDSCYNPDIEDEKRFGISNLCDIVHDSHLVWAPDGDEAFDDWSHILQFDVGDRVRLIAFRSIEGNYHHDPRTLQDIWLGTDEFYSILQEWLEEFMKAWTAAPKISETGDGAEPR
jgi:Immunity protein 42